jgi:iron(III) transport system substrate-binding protein
MKLGLLLCLAALLAPAQEDRIVVVYVSHDQEHSEGILKRFEAKSGIRVQAQFDTEDNKTVGLVNRIIQEAAAPVADVFWNNEAAQSERLRRKGLLEPYISPEAAGIPPAFKDAEGHWTGFAARARVLIWNRELVRLEDLPRSLLDLTRPAWKGRFALARPLTGTTLTHAGALHALWGEARTEEFFDALMAQSPRFEAGNAQVSRIVAEGTCPIGLTDTDDVHGRRLEGAPVDAAYLDQGEGDIGTLVIPNTVMILRGARHPSAARRLVDFLLSAEVEEALASGRAAQIPLRAGVKHPPHVRGVAEIRGMAVDFGAVGASLEAYKPALDRRFIEGRMRREGESEAVSRPLLFAMAALVLVLVFAWRALRPGRRGA